jgi:uncharacterized protein (DUF885 family)
MLLILICRIFFFPSFAQDQDFKLFASSFTEGYRQLDLPETIYDYKEYFNSIQSAELLKKQLSFFSSFSERLKKINRTKLSPENRIVFDHIQYETEFNIRRINLETAWNSGGRKIPARGLYGMDNYKEWYAYFIQKFTSENVSPEEIMNYGLKEIERINEEITKLQLQLGYKDRQNFYRALQSDSFYYFDKKDVVRAFALTDSCVRHHLQTFIGKAEVPEVFAMEWPDAGPNTPPGIYLGRDENAYGKDVFQYNFYKKKYSKRAIDWIYLHEAIPGHHLQASLRRNAKRDSVQLLFLYPGNFEGWACYVEYAGNNLGVYSNILTQLGHLEWDLIRSARLVLETGIHYFGWSREKARDYWAENIYGQDDIADREITRVTNWPGQSLSYKLGARFIFTLREKTGKQRPSVSLQKFNRCFLNFGMLPLPVIEKNFDDMLNRI